MARPRKAQPKQETPADTKKQGKQDRPKLEKVGALWLSESNGRKFLSGRITTDENNEMRILVFKNDYKEEEKHPDYQIFLIPKEGAAKTGMPF